MKIATDNTFEPNLSSLTPANLRFRIVAARCQRVEDSYDQGEIGEEGYEDRDFNSRATYGSIPEAFHETFGNLPEAGPDREHIGTIDNTIYCDLKSGETRVVDARGARGVHRAIFDRQETNRGHIPSDEVVEKWKAGEGKLYTGRYELEFEILIAALDEKALADVCGINCWM